MVVTRSALGWRCLEMRPQPRSDCHLLVSVIAGVGGCTVHGREDSSCGGGRVEIDSGRSLLSISLANATLAAAIEQGGPFPIVLLEHGSGVVPAMYTILAEGLASHGFVVAATNHPPDSLIAVFPDGQEVRSKPYWPVDADRRTQGVAIGRFAEDVLVADVRFVLDQLQEMNSRDTFWRGHINASKIGIVGHSMGGTTSGVGD